MIRPRKKLVRGELGKIELFSCGKQQQHDESFNATVVTYDATVVNQARTAIAVHRGTARKSHEHVFYNVTRLGAHENMLAKCLRLGGGFTKNQRTNPTSKALKYRSVNS